jgi:hypothetical protein
MVIGPWVDDPTTTHVVPLTTDLGDAERVLKVIDDDRRAVPEEATPVVLDVQSGVLHIVGELEMIWMLVLVVGLQSPVLLHG